MNLDFEQLWTTAFELFCHLIKYTPFKRFTWAGNYIHKPVIHFIIFEVFL